jgi:hypothetical protein
VFSLRSSRLLADQETACCYRIRRQNRAANKSFLYVHFPKLCWPLLMLNPDYQSERVQVWTQSILERYTNIMMKSLIFREISYINIAIKDLLLFLVSPRLRYAPRRWICLCHHLNKFSVHWAIPCVVCIVKLTYAKTLSSSFCFQTTVFKIVIRRSQM